MTAGHKYDSPVLRKVFSSETNAGSDNSARGAVAPALERRVRCERDRRYAIVSPRRADRQIARTIATHRRRRERLDETPIYSFQRQYTITENFRYVCLQGDAIITADIGPTREDLK